MAVSAINSSGAILNTYRVNDQINEKRCVVHAIIHHEFARKAVHVSSTVSEHEYGEIRNECISISTGSINFQGFFYFENFMANF